MFVDKGDDYWHSRGIPKATYNEAVAAGRFEGWVDMYEDIIDLELITTPGNVVESGRATSTWAFPSFDFLDNVVPPLAWDDLPEYLRAKGQAVINNKVTSLYGGVLQPEAYRSLDELFAAARVAKADLDKMVVQIADRTSGKGLVAPLKKQARAAQKVAGKYGGDMRQLNDVARASIMYDSVDDLYEGLQRIGKEKGVRIVNIKDSFANVRINPATGNPSAYHDVQLILMMPNEHRVELQLHVFKLWEAKEGMTLTHKLPNGTWQIGGVPAAQARVAGHTFYEEMRVILESGTKYSKEEMATLLRLDNQTLAVYMPPYRDALYGFASQIDDVATIPKPPVPVKIVPKKGSVKLSLIDDNHVPRLEVMSEVRGVVDDISYYSPDPRALGASVHDETITTVTNRVPLQVDGKDIGFIDLDIDVNLEAAGLRDDLSGLGLDYRDALASKEGVPNINPGTVRISGISVASEYDEIEVLQQALSELMEKPVIGTSAFDRAIYIPTDSVSPTLRRYLQAAIGQVEGPSVRKSTGVVYSASQKKFLFPGYAVRPDYRHSLPSGKGPRHKYINLEDAKGHTIKEYLDDMDLNRQLVHGDDAYIRADEYVDGLGELTRKQYVDQADTVLSDVIAEADVFIRVDKDVARKVLVDGEVLNQGASGSSHGLFHVKARNSLEEIMYGIPRDDESFKRPVYGYLARNADGVGALNREILSDLNLKSSVTAPTFTDVSDMGTSGYGHVAYKLKPVKRANTTFTVGDSLDGIGDIVRHNTGLVDDELAAAGGLTSTNTQKILTGFMADIDDPARNVGRNLSTPSSPVPSYVNDPKRWSPGPYPIDHLLGSLT